MFLKHSRNVKMKENCLYQLHSGKLAWFVRKILSSLSSSRFLFYLKVSRLIKSYVFMFYNNFICCHLVPKLKLTRAFKGIYLVSQPSAVTLYIILPEPDYGWEGGKDKSNPTGSWPFQRKTSKALGNAAVRMTWVLSNK